MKYAFIKQTCHCHSIAALCRGLGVSRSGYYEWSGRGPSQRERSDAHLLKSIEAIHQQHRGAYGALKTYKQLQAQGISAGKHRVARLRSQAGIEARRKQRFRVSVEHHKTPEAAPDLVNRAFTAPAPDKVWVPTLVLAWAAVKSHLKFFLSQSTCVAPSAASLGRT